MKRAVVNQPPVPAVGTIGGIGGTNPIGSGDEWGPNPVDFALDDLSDVDTTGVTDGQTIVYDAGSMTWIPGGSSAATMWVPVMTEVDTDVWSVAVTGDGDAIMTEVPL